MESGWTSTCAFVPLLVTTAPPVESGRGRVFPASSVNAGTVRVGEAPVEPLVEPLVEPVGDGVPEAVPVSVEPEVAVDGLLDFVQPVTPRTRAVMATPVAAILFMRCGPSVMPDPSVRDG
jgi:hypothetical protein